MLDFDIMVIWLEQSIENSDQQRMFYQKYSI